MMRRATIETANLETSTPNPDVKLPKGASSFVNAYLNTYQARLKLSAVYELTRP